jgi:hypothetical protein
VFECAYNDQSQTWQGLLTIPGVEMFHGTASGVFKLMAKLDNLYREYLARKEGT